MSEEIEIDDDFIDDDAEPSLEDEAPAETSKSNLTKRRVIDNLLEERRLQKELADFSFDFDD